MKKIAFVSTGGTIAMKAGANGLAIPRAGAKELLAEVSNLKDKIIINEFEFSNMPSAHLSLINLAALREFLMNLCEKAYDGIVITHGTDTMEETAYFLDLSLNNNIPVVLTGAQKNLSALGTDAICNIIDALRVAADDKAASMGVLVVFSSEILAARDATKFHRTRLDAFKSIEFGPIGSVDNEFVIWHRRPLLRDFYGLGSKRNLTIDIVLSYLGADSRQILHSVSDRADGLIIQALGAGHIPQSMLAGIENAIALSIPVILGSRPLAGRFLTNTYGFKGSEKYLHDMGLIFGEDLSVQKLRIKLFILMSLGYTTDQIRYEFEKNHYQSN